MFAKISQQVSVTCQYSKPDEKCCHDYFDCQPEFYDFKCGTPLLGQHIPSDECESSEGNSPTALNANCDAKKCSNQYGNSEPGFIFSENVGKFSDDSGPCQSHCRPDDRLRLSVRYLRSPIPLSV